MVEPILIFLFRNRGEKMRKILLWISVIMIVVLLTYFSSQPYMEQDLQPFLAENFDTEWVRINFGSVKFFYAGSEVSVYALGSPGFIEFFLRKGAHFSIFFTLGFFFYFAIRGKIGVSYKRILISFLFVLICAMLDETHQYFTEDRSPLMEDVILDTVGGLSGITLASVLSRKKKSSS